MGNQEARRERRRRVLQGELRPLEITSKIGSLTGHVLDLSSHGLSIQIPPDAMATVEERELIRIQFPTIAEPLRGRIVYKGQEQRLGQSVDRIGISLISETPPSQLKHTKIHFPASQRPIVLVQHPLIRSVEILGTMHELWREGFHFEVEENRSGCLLPGLLVQTHIRMKRGGDVPLTVRITRLRHDGKSTWVQCRFAGENESDMESLARLVLYNDRTTSFPDLWRAGFRLRDVNNLLEYQVASTDVELDDILQLRLRTLAPQLKNQVHRDVVQDHWDLVGEHIYASLAFRMVAAARLFFPNSGQALSEHHSLFERLPKEIWDQGFLEVSRLVVDPEFRGTSLLETLLQHILFIGQQSQQKFIVMAIPEASIRLFESLGARNLGLSHQKLGLDLWQRPVKQSFAAIAFDLQDYFAKHPFPLTAQAS